MTIHEIEEAQKQAKDSRAYLAVAMFEVARQMAKMNWREDSKREVEELNRVLGLDVTARKETTHA